MASRLALFVATALCASAATLAAAAPILPLAAHRAAYDISLADSSSSGAVVCSDADFGHRTHRL